MFNFYGIAMITCGCGFIVNVVILIVQHVQIRKLKRKRNELLGDLGMSQEELRQSPQVKPFFEKKTENDEETGEIGEEPNKEKKSPKKVRFEGLSTLSTDMEKGRNQSGKEKLSTSTESEKDSQIGNPLSADINAFTTFLEEYQMALDTPIQVSPIRPYQKGTLLTKYPFPPEKPSTTTDALKRLIVDVLRQTIHWQHPQYFGQNGPGRSVPDVAAHFFLPFLSPNIIELERISMKFLKKALGIPEEFYKETMIESATEAVFHVLLTARKRQLEKLFEKAAAPGKMVVYCSTTANVSISKACRLAMMRLRRIEGLNAATFEKILKEDIAADLLPTVLISTWTSSDYSNPEEQTQLFKLTAQYDVYIHVDASAVGGYWLHPACRRLRPSLLDVDSVYLEMFHMSEGIKLIWIKSPEAWHEPLTQHTQKAVQIFTVFALLGLEEIQRRLEFFSGMAKEIRLEMAKLPKISIIICKDFTKFHFQYKPSSSADPSQISYYTKRLYAHLQKSHRFYFGYTQVGQKPHRQAVIVVNVMGGSMNKIEMQEMIKELGKMLEEFEQKKDDPALLSAAMSPIPPNSLFSFVPASSLHYDVTTI